VSLRHTALVIGATGGVGGSVAQALLKSGWHVRALSRRPPAGADAIEWIQGDAMDAAAVTAAARGAEILFHGANPPRYRNWRGLALPMLDHSIAAAEASGARLVFPGTIYNFGPDAGTLLDERSPQHPVTRKGAVRVEMEERLQQAAARGMRVLIVRAGDYFGGSSLNSWFNSMVTPGRPIRRVIDPGEPAVGHAWAYLPDLADAIVRLIAIDAALAPFEIVHFGGHWLDRGNEMAAAIRRAAGRPDLAIWRFPWPVVRLTAPFVPLFRELAEMRYLWQRPLRLDNRKLIGLLGNEPHTPLDQAVRSALAGLGCLAQEDTASGGITGAPVTPPPIRN